MVSQEFTVKNPTGIHARPASMLVMLCNKLPGEIKITTDKEKTVNPRAILSVLMGGMNKGTKITVEVSGENEEDSLKQIIELLESFEE
ncbi:MAG: HPr family phosphocarrier protein [Erysipelotrichaceae bacterium]|jgi:phosphocarrier protein|nr:HPr family phosphocarrier protein [Erysipelotrichaceae bacterium]